MEGGVRHNINIITNNYFKVSEFTIQFNWRFL